jgi:hypothetical protein
MRRRNRPWSVLALLAGCTFVTDSNDRKVVDKLDFELVMMAMTAHQATQVDVALVVPADPTAPATGPDTTNSNTVKYVIRGRARVLLPPASAVPGAIYPDVQIRLGSIVGDEPLEVLFYADTNNNFVAEPLLSGLRNEHSWTRVVPHTGKVVFPHNIMFQNFYDAEIMAVGSDIVLDVPDFSATPARAACLNAQLSQLVKSSLEARITLNPEQSPNEVCAFKMHVGNVLPSAPIRCKGISDMGSAYGIDAVIDDKVIRTGLSSPADANGVTIPLAQWLPLDAAVLASCLAL